MTRTFNSLMALGLLILLASGCSRGGTDVEKKEGPSKNHFKITVDLDGEKKLQSAVDQGYKSWKNNAADVAEESIINTGTGARSGEIRILSEDKSTARVLIETKDGKYIVTVKRLVRPDGIWTATDIEKEK